MSDDTKVTQEGTPEGIQESSAKIVPSTNDLKVILEYSNFPYDASNNQIVIPKTITIKKGDGEIVTLNVTYIKDIASLYKSDKYASLKQLFDIYTVLNKYNNIDDDGNITGEISKESIEIITKLNDKITDIDSLNNVVAQLKAVIQPSAQGGGKRNNRMTKKHKKRSNKTKRVV